MNEHAKELGFVNAEGYVYYYHTSIYGAFQLRIRKLVNAFGLHIRNGKIR